MPGLPRRQDVSKFGQACRAQSGLMSSRSPLAKAVGTLASTAGAKPGRMVSAAATNAAIAIAERALIMTVPIRGALAAPPFSLTTSYPPTVSGRFRAPGIWFRRAGDLFRRPLPDDTMRELAGFPGAG